MKPGPSCPNRLLVEGKDDQFAVINLLIRHGYNWASSEGPYVSDCGGVTEMLTTLPVAVKSYQRVGAIIDADLSLTDRWSQVRSALTASGLTLPKKPVPGGLIIEGSRPNTRLGLWFMPDNRAPGKLEDFLVQLVPDDQEKVWKLAETSTRRALEEGAKLRSIDTVKGSIHTFLAWQEVPGLPFGTALTAEFLNHEGPGAKDFVDWFIRLFKPA